MSTSTNNSRLKFTYSMLLCATSNHFMDSGQTFLEGRSLGCEDCGGEAGFQHGNSLLWI